MEGASGGAPGMRDIEPRYVAASLFSVSSRVGPSACAPGPVDGWGKFAPGRGGGLGGDGEGGEVSRACD